MIWLVQGRRQWMRHALVVVVGSLLLSGCGAEGPQPLASPDPNAFSGPLMGFHQMVSSAYLQNSSKSPVRLISVRPASAYNVDVVRVRVVPAHLNGDPDAEGMWGALRWPRAGDDELGRVFDQARPVQGFVLPADSMEDWMVTVQYRQRDEAKSMRIAGVTVDYMADRQRHRIELEDAFCFTTPTDEHACPSYSD